MKAHFTQLICDLPRAQFRKLLKRVKDLPQYDGYGENTIFLKFNSQEEKERVVDHLKKSINKTKDFVAK